MSTTLDEAMILRIPIYVCDEARTNGPDWIVSFQCPCGSRHEHGWGDDEPRNEPQHRNAHCSEPNPTKSKARRKAQSDLVGRIHGHGYYIVVSDEPIAHAEYL